MSAIDGLGGHVYFITDGEAIKIGWSGAPKLRMQGLQTSHHKELRILATVIGSDRDELKIHHQFAHLRLRGEWFRPEPELLRFIQEFCGPETEIRRVRRELRARATGKSDDIKYTCRGLDTFLRLAVENPKQLPQVIASAARAVKALGASWPGTGTDREAGG